MIVVRKNKPKMNHFQTLRLSMIQNQLRPAGITNEKLLNVFQKIQRELYVFNINENIAYHDQLIPLSKTRYLLPALTIAKLLNKINLDSVEKALIIGCGLGYTLQLLKYLHIQVFGIDQTIFITEAIKKHPKLSSHIKSGSLFAGFPEQAPFDLIFIEGGIETIPLSLIKQLSIGGYFCTLIYREEHLPFIASIFIKEDENTLKPIHSFDSVGSLLPEFSNITSFEF